MRIAGIPSLLTAVVFHQFGAPSREIFSSVVNLLTRFGTDALRKSSCTDIATENEEKQERRSLPLFHGSHDILILCEIFIRGSDARGCGKTSGSNLSLESHLRGLARSKKRLGDLIVRRVRVSVVARASGRKDVPCRMICDAQTGSASRHPVLLRSHGTHPSRAALVYLHMLRWPQDPQATETPPQMLARTGGTHRWQYARLE